VVNVGPGSHLADDVIVGEVGVGRLKYSFANLA